MGKMEKIEIIIIGRQKIYKKKNLLKKNRHGGKNTWRDEIIEMIEYCFLFAWFKREEEEEEEDEEEEEKEEGGSWNAPNPARE